MLIVRSIRENDLDPLHDLVQQSEYGLTTLKISKEALADRIERSLYAFQQTTAKPQGQPYVFVMEDLAVGRIVGTCAIYSKIGGFEPVYSYEIKTSIHENEESGIRKEVDVLHLNKIHDGPSEIGSLFLSPDYWGDGHGRLLSMSRFLFMAEFIDRFEDEMVAEMRGVVNKNGHAPMWDAIGSHFFQVEFPRAETMTSQSKHLIADLMPIHPIYIPLLPQDAQDVIGQVHENTRPALAMLKKEGFQFQNRVDIFDGGPTLHCKTSEIRTVKECRRRIVSAIHDEVDGQRQLIANTRLDYCACLGWLNDIDDESCELDSKTALQLRVKVGDPIRYASLKPTGKTVEPKTVKKKNVQ